MSSWVVVASDASRHTQKAPAAEAFAPWGAAERRSGSWLAVTVRRLPGVQGGGRRARATRARVAGGAPRGVLVSSERPQVSRAAGAPPPRRRQSERGGGSRSPDPSVEDATEARTVFRGGPARPGRGWGRAEELRLRWCRGYVGVAVTLVSRLRWCRGCCCCHAGLKERGRSRSDRERSKAFEAFAVLASAAAVTPVRSVYNQERPRLSRPRQYRQARNRLHSKHQGTRSHGYPLRKRRNRRRRPLSGPRRRRVRALPSARSGTTRGHSRPHP